MSTQAQNSVEADDYNVRVVGPRLIKKALKQEQNSRYQATGTETPVMTIAKEWLVEKANAVLSQV